MIDDLEWRTDEYGRERSALWLRGLYLGGILEFRTLQKDNPRHGLWRGFINTEYEAVLIEWFNTADECRQAVMDAAKAALA